MAKLYADEEFPWPVVVELRSMGHDVLTVQEAGKAGQRISDYEVLAYAISQGRAVLSRNRWHFMPLHTRVRPHCGIIVCTDGSAFLGQAVRIHQAILNHPVLDNQLIRVYRPQQARPRTPAP